jgi:serine/threonine protein kinase
MAKVKRKTLKRFNLSRKNNTMRVSYGGEAIDSGGYGCVFKPALKCKSIYPVSISNNKYVSKLMSKEDASEEFDILQKFANIIIKSGKKNMLRFMVLSGITLCSVTPSQEDLDEYNTKCSRLVEKNGLNSVTDLVSLNMPYAGKNLLKLFNELRIQNTVLNKRILTQYFQGMKRLFQGGLFLLYETTPKIIHGDLKEENILCKYNETFTNIYDEIKLIDWGLSFTYDITNPRQAIQHISRRPLQFNLPFGILLFSNYFYREYNNLVLIPLKTNPGKLVELVRRFCDTYYNDSFFKNGRDDSKPNSLKDFNEFVYNVMGQADNSIFQTSLTSYIRINLSKILIKYTNNGIFDKDAYAYDYYLPMVDTYSFILTYGNVLSYLLHTRKHSRTSVEQYNLTKLILFITRQLKVYCLNFDERINGNIYRKKVYRSITEMTNLCMELLK